MPDIPETLAETQARLARMQPGPAQTPPVSPPSVSSPVPSVSGPPPTPYGPPPTGMPDPAQLGGVGEFGTAPTRPDPYATSAFPSPVLTPVPAVPRRAGAIVGIAAGAVALIVIAGVVAFNAFQMSPDPLPPGAEPEYPEEWQNFPGVSYIDPNEALNQPSFEDVVATADAVVADYRESLTAEFGLIWTQRYEAYSDVESNGYGGDSMLYYYDAGTWQGQVQLNDPGARERMFEIFTKLAAANGGDGVLLRNELYADDPDLSRGDFGAVEMDDQALWSFFDSFPSIASGYLSVDVIDRNLPVDDAFDGDYMFTYEESSDTLYVTIDCYASALLKEADREEFEAALEPYHGDYEP